jgi:hypothetical protein
VIIDHQKAKVPTTAIIPTHNIIVPFPVIALAAPKPTRRAAKAKIIGIELCSGT